MATNNYLTVQGEIVGQNKGGTKGDYVPDPLGSTASLLNNAQAQSVKFTYWPYGEVRNVSAPHTERFEYVGTLGCLTEVVSDRILMRTRIERPKQGRWLTVDPLWPREHKYGYAHQSPIAQMDSFGEGPLATSLLQALIGCKVYHCKFNGGFRHEFMCTEGLFECSSGNYPGWIPCKGGKQGDNTYGGNCLIGAGSGPDDYQCSLVSTNCAEAQALCNEVAKGVPDWWGTRFCYGYACLLTCSMCNAYAIGSAARKKCVCSRCPCTISGGLRSCLDPNMATMYDCNWVGY